MNIKKLANKFAFGAENPSKIRVAVNLTLAVAVPVVCYVIAKRLEANAEEIVTEN